MQSLAKSPSLTNQEIEGAIRESEHSACTSSFKGARITGAASALFTASAFAFAEGVTWLMLILGGVGWICTYSMWADGRAGRLDLKGSYARIIWRELDKRDFFGANESLKTRHITRDIARIYQLDPQGEVFPVSQAIRLVLVWRQQQKRLQLVTEQIGRMRVLRDTLLEKQKLLHQLNDHNSGLEKTLSHLDGDFGPLDRICDALLASCTRLEAMIASVEAAARRRQLHREVNHLTSQISPHAPELSSLELDDEHLDLERQITREIETFLQLERETDVHLRDM